LNLLQSELLAQVFSQRSSTSALHFNPVAHDVEVHLQIFCVPPLGNRQSSSVLQSDAEEQVLTQTNPVGWHTSPVAQSVLCVATVQLLPEEVVSPQATSANMLLAASPRKRPFLRSMKPPSRIIRSGKNLVLLAPGRIPVKLPSGPTEGNP
jgi:hypothetical protein